MQPSYTFNSSELSYAYVNCSNLNSLNNVMLHCGTIDQVIEFYRQETYEFFEQQSSLDILARRWKLKDVTSFKELVGQYDTDYATTRSFFLDNRSEEEVIVQASKQGDYETVVFGLVMYKSLRTRKVYKRIARYSGKSIKIARLMIDFGVKCFYDIGLSACRHGNLELFKLLVEKYDVINRKKKCDTRFIGIAIKHCHYNVIDYITEKDPRVKTKRDVLLSIYSPEAYEHLESRGFSMDIDYVFNQNIISNYELFVYLLKRRDYRISKNDIMRLLVSWHVEHIKHLIEEVGIDKLKLDQQFPLEEWVTCAEVDNLEYLFSIGVKPNKEHFVDIIIDMQMEEIKVYLEYASLDMVKEVLSEFISEDTVEERFDERGYDYSCYDVLDLLLAHLKKEDSEWLNIHLTASVIKYILSDSPHDVFNLLQYVDRGFISMQLSAAIESFPCHNDTLRMAKKMLGMI